MSRLRLRSNDAAYLTLRKALRNVFITVETDRASESGKKRRKIRDLIEIAGNYRFERTDAMGNVTPMSVAVRLPFI